MKKKLLAIMTAVIMAVTGSAGAMAQNTEFASAAAEDPYTVKTLGGEVPTEQQNYMTDSQYKKLLGIDLSSKTVDAFDPDDTYNPLDGYQPTVLNELFLGYMNRTNNYDGYFTVMENASNDSGFNMNTMWNTNYGGNIKYYGEDSNEDMFTHAINTIALTPGDMSEEGAHTRQQILIESRLVLMEDGFLHEDDTHQMLSTYTYDGNTWNRKGCTDTCISDSHWAWRIDVAEQQSYTAMAVGDYDGDNYNEVAVYVPSSTVSKEMAKVDIYQPKQNGDTYHLEKEYSFYIDEMGSRFDVWTEKYHSYVHLNTTHMAGRDDLVVNVTQPWLTEYDFIENGALAVWSFQNGNKKLEYNNELEYGDCRFKMSASVNADINGDGVDEVVVGGFKNTSFGDSSSDRGNISDTQNLVNVLIYEDGEYELAWNTPQNTDAIDLFHSFEMDAPVAMAAGKFRSGAVKDTVFLEGTYLDFVAGAGSTGNDRIRNGKFTQDTSESMSGMSNKTINLGASGSFVSDKTALEQVVFYTVDGTNEVDVDIVWGHPGTDGKIQTNVVNDNYINDTEANDGTIISMCAANVDEDSALMKYAGKYVGWSNPVVYGVLLSMPYWQEMDYGDVWNDRGETDFGVTKTKEDGTEVTVGVDLDEALTITVEEEMIGNGLSVGVNFDFLAGYAYSKNETTSLAKSITWSSGGGVDAAAILVMPVVTYEYELLIPEHTATEEEKATGKDTDGDGIVEAYRTTMLCTNTFEPVYTQVSVDTYNDVVEEFNAVAKDEDKLPLIDLDEIYAGAKTGDPSTYAENPKDISSVEGDDYLYVDEVYATTGKDKAVETLSIETGSSTTRSDGFTLGLKAGYMGEVIFGFNMLSILSVSGKLGLGVSGQIQSGGTWTTTDSTGITYSGSFANLPEEAKGLGYEYSAGLVKWETSLNGHDEDLTFEDSDEVLTDKTIIVGPVVMMDEQVPPALPLDLHVLGVTEDKAVLEWTNPPSVRAADYYKIYYSKEADGQYYPLDGTVDGNKTRYVVSGLDPDTTYYFKIESYGKALKSVKGPAVSATTKTGSEPIITKHPQDCHAAVGSSAVFEIAAKPQTEGNTISYQWQQLSFEDYGVTWKDVNAPADDTVGKEAVFNAAYASPEGVIRESDVDDMDGNVYRCIVTEHVAGKLDYIETISNSAQLYVGESVLEETALSLSVSDGTLIEDTEIQLQAGDDFTVSAALKDSAGSPISGKTVWFAVLDKNQDDKCIWYTSGNTGNDGTATVSFEDIAAGEYEVVAVMFKDDEYRGTVSNSVSVKAAEVFTISYELDGGVNHNLNPITFSEGTSVIVLRAPSKSDHNFTGWYLDADRTRLVEHNILYLTEPKEHITLYAGWEKDVDEPETGGDSGSNDPSGGDSGNSGGDEPDSNTPDGNGSGSGSGTQTGDDFGLAIPLAVTVAALGICLALLKRRHIEK